MTTRTAPAIAFGLLAAWLTPASAQAPAAAPETAVTQRATKGDTPAPGKGFERVAAQAAAAREAGRIDDAVALYEQAVRLRPGWEEGHWYLGTMHYQRGRYREAGEAFRRLLIARKSAADAPTPALGRVYAMKGLCDFQTQRYDTALSELLRARELRVETEELMAAVRYHVAILLTRFEHYDHALLTLQTFAQEGNDNPTVVEAFGIASLRMPLLPAELPPDRREMVLLAGRGAYYQAARLGGRAGPAFEELVRRYPDYPNVHYAYGVHLLAEQADRGIDAFKQELKRSPGHVPSILQIAFAYITRYDWESARPWAEEAVKLAPADFASRRAMGQVLLELGDTKGAVEHLERGVKLAPDSPSLRFTLARAYQRAGRRADADRERAEFRRLQQLSQSQRFGDQAVGGIVDTIGPLKPGGRQ